MELNCYNLTPNKDIRMGLPEYQNSINHLNDGANQIPRIQSESKWFSIIFKRCKCPENGQKVADIYERVRIQWVTQSTAMLSFTVGLLNLNVLLISY